MRERNERWDGGAEGGGTNVSFMGRGWTEMAQRGAKLTPLQEQRTGKHQWHHPPIPDRHMQVPEGMAGMGMGMGAAYLQDAATAVV